MSTPSSPIDPRARRWGIFAKYAALLAVGFFVAPYIWVAIGGLVGLIVAGGIVGGTWMLLPWIEDKARNLRLMLVKSEAAKNPIESLENEYGRRSQALEERSQRILALAAKTENFGSQLSEFKHRFPDKAIRYQQVYDKMQTLVKDSRAQWQKAKVGLDSFEGQIEEAKAEWAMAISASDLQKDAGQVEQEFLAKIRTSAAFESVQTGMNTAIASVDQLLMEAESSSETNVSADTSQAALPAPDAASVIDIDSAPVAEPVRVRTTHR